MSQLQHEVEKCPTWMQHTNYATSINKQIWQRLNETNEIMSLRKGVWGSERVGRLMSGNGRKVSCSLLSLSYCEECSWVLCRQRKGFVLNQSQPFGSWIPRNETSGGTFKFMALHRAQDIRGSYAGHGITVARSIPSDAIIFLIYDGLKKYSGSY